ncbi:adenylate cyclase type 3-like [Babylonia areolata]|uniref:adenylate cyclase type 3-like n=1 Tax=Babylonia areolata TaxID=304850 RepID=UPI003FD622DC
MNFADQNTGQLSSSSATTGLVFSKCCNKNTTSGLKKIFFGRFPDDYEEQLYQEYMWKQKMKIIPSFVLIMFIYLLGRLGLDMAIFDSVVQLTRMATHIFFILTSVAVLCLLICRPDMRKWVASLCVVVLWGLVMASLLVDVAVQSQLKSASSLVGWVQVIIFTTFVVVPWKLRHCVGMSITIALAHSVEMFVLRNNNSTSEEELIHSIIVEELVSDALLFLCAIFLGILVFVFSERKQRRSFVESKKSHAVSCMIEKEHKEQMRLLEAVLPKYVARVMMKDLGCPTHHSESQFRKIYMERFEDISILFADIVGFTAISSSVPAPELVKILNQLFANFDSLATKYHQQRIKILGDCYYCVCGINKVEVRPDHSVLCIHMGMTMVDAIRDVRRSTGKDVNMRVGIHTGPVLAGVMGQRQWQYDVLGQQVILANHMESSGLPARVHISQATKDQLSDQFELEPGFGQDRDDFLRMENVTSYLVKSILKPYPEGTLDADLKTLKDIQETEMAKAAKGTGAASDESLDPLPLSQLTLRQALFNNYRSRTMMQKLSVFTTWFHDPLVEVRYRERRENFSGASMGALSMVLFLSSLAKMAVLPRMVTTIVVSVVAEVILIAMTIVSTSYVFNTRWIPKAVARVGSVIEGNRVARMYWGLGAITILILADMTMLLQCDVGRAETGLRNRTAVHLHNHNDPVCVVPAYIVHVVHLILLGVSTVVQIEHMTRLCIILICSVVHVVLYVVVYGPIFDLNDAIVRPDDRSGVPSKYDLSVQLLTAALAIIIINRKMEEISRRLFQWREDAEEKTLVAQKERLKNEELVYNILPEHVARYFIGKDRHHMEMYHHAYDNVAVMFAACPNFHDFYNESDVNNQGLECLRLLNEIISDYDELLDKPKFKSKITKIKTVGPTYMAASGMVGRCAVFQDEDLLSQLQHLDDMVQFALAMTAELRHINQQSFNSFLLRIGINHGPIVAGVIGVTKPHYDIWGNTVNVASRMESTGMPGQIQVVEETKDMLELFGYNFQKRGRIHVKGKGELTTYFLTGRDEAGIVSTLPHVPSALA